MLALRAVTNVTDVANVPDVAGVTGNAGAARLQKCHLRLAPRLLLLLCQLLPLATLMREALHLRSRLPRRAVHLTCRASTCRLKSSLRNHRRRSVSSVSFVSSVSPVSPISFVSSSSGRPASSVSGAIGVAV